LVLAGEAMRRKAMSMHAATAVLVLGAVVSLGACAKQAPVPERAAEVTTEAARVPAPAQALPLVVVHKSPSCGCCGLWVHHMRQAGFQVEVRDEDNVNPVKERVGVPYGKGRAIPPKWPAISSKATCRPRT
jgi:hypothetical protein